MNDPVFPIYYHWFRILTFDYSFDLMNPISLAKQQARKQEQAGS